MPKLTKKTVEAVAINPLKPRHGHFGDLGKFDHGHNNGIRPRGQPFSMPCNMEVLWSLIALAPAIGFLGEPGVATTPSAFAAGSISRIAVLAG